MLTCNNMLELMYLCEHGLRWPALAVGCLKNHFLPFPCSLRWYISYWQLLLWLESLSLLLHCSFNEIKLITSLRTSGSVTCILLCVLPLKLHDITWFCQDCQTVRWQRSAMQLYPISLPLKVSPGEPEIPVSLLGSCLSQPQLLKADEWQSIYQAWKLEQQLWYQQPSLCSGVRSNQWPPLPQFDFMLIAPGFTPTRYFLGPSPSAHTELQWQVD